MCCAIPYPWFAPRLSVWRINISRVPGRKSGSVDRISPIDSRWKSIPWSLLMSRAIPEGGHTQIVAIAAFLFDGGGEKENRLGSSRMVGHPGVIAKECSAE